MNYSVLLKIILLFQKANQYKKKILFKCKEPWNKYCNGDESCVAWTINLYPLKHVVFSATIGYSQELVCIIKKRNTHIAKQHSSGKVRRGAEHCVLQVPEQAMQIDLLSSLYNHFGWWAQNGDACKTSHPSSYAINNKPHNNDTISPSLQGEWLCCVSTQSSTGMGGIWSMTEMFVWNGRPG